MIISDTYRFAFIHIPKCAGTTVRQYLGQYDQKTMPLGLKHHTEFGVLDYNHIPLKILRAFFASEYEKVSDYFSFAIMREPFSRFPSSLNQRLVLHKKQLSVQMTQRQLQIEVDEVIGLLSQMEDHALLPADLIHFQKQVSYVFDEGKRIIDNLYTADHVADLFIDLENKTGIETVGYNPIEKKYNASHRIYKSNFARKTDEKTRVFRRAILKWLPTMLDHQIENKFFVHPRDLKLFSSEYVKDFVKSYYRDDLILYGNLINEMRA